jgi:hypothetical protein
MGVDGTPLEPWVLKDTLWLLNRDEIDKLRLESAKLEACDAALRDCNKAVVSVPARPGFWHTPRGREIVVGGVAFSIPAAFIGGVLFAHSLSH